MKKKNCILVLILLFLTGCSSNGENNKKEDLSLNSNESLNVNKQEQNEFIENGFKIGDYIYIDDGAKNDVYFEKILEQKESLKDNFDKVLNKIDNTKRINLLPYSAFYYEDLEQYEINLFLVNTSEINIENGNFIGVTNMNDEFMKLQGGLTNFEDINKMLKPNEFELISYRFPVSKDKKIVLEGIKIESINFVVQDLIINGESVSNEN
ncbi:hypothetical protein RAK27_16100 [Carnobacterium maltaromaticum]|uniref:DUF5067 domain-containing protein n=1 Tax=Carnobacterium maltaromaticum TaxID=2751 RepID=A0AAW9JTJ9_CARML|nr:hypothetical protein [Carnobacterium maltaromaticum]MDZ5760160.1 hypothetical protein [Carnobacterium maltaromaticum]